MTCRAVPGRGNHRSGKSCVSIFISKKDACLGALVVAVMTWHPAMMDLSRIQQQRNIAATPSGAPVLEGGSETEIAWQIFRPTRGNDKRRADSFGAGSRKGNNETEAHR